VCVLGVGDQKNVVVKEQRTVFGKKEWAQFVTLCYEGQKNNNLKLPYEKKRGS
jgi:hypothetical protein